MKTSMGKIESSEMPVVDSKAFTASWKLVKLNVGSLSIEETGFTEDLESPANVVSAAVVEYSDLFLERTCFVYFLRV
jgi:hypothetical protein